MKDYQNTNKLINEKSPYLLQHAHNPVNWFPWGEEAFQKAKSEEKPIFLSIGYSTCHWCHVMERESFEDSEVAEILNQSFISIKVDREERPDIDHIYMTVCQALTGHGGWPLSIFMDADRRPFYAGTYFPKKDSRGLPGLITLLKSVISAWNQNRESLNQTGNKILSVVKDFEDGEGEINPQELVKSAFEHYKLTFDQSFGGFGRAPKFPTPHHLFFLLRYWYIYQNQEALEMVEKTLGAMRRGGIYDHLGFGFSRYSTDRKWLVPHFEKMLYDNALLAIAYLETYHSTKKEEYLKTGEAIFTYILRDMTSPEGGFYSAEDADSEGEEGKFYVWKPEEIYHILGDREGKEFCRLFDITPVGNFEGLSIPNRILTPKEEHKKSENDFINQWREKLFKERENRVHPYKDDKILTSWNGLMIAALAIGGRVAEKTEYTQAAEKAASFIFQKLINNEGRLLARYRDGEGAIKAYVDDYAFLIWGLIELYETTYKPEYLKKALMLNEGLLKLFWDQEKGGFYLYGRDSEELITRPKEIYDGATPSGNSVAAMNLLKLGRLTGNYHLEEQANQIFRAFGKSLSANPGAHSFLMCAVLFYEAKTKDVIVVEKEMKNGSSEMLQILRKNFSPFTLSLFHWEESREMEEMAPFVSGYKTVEGHSTAYICENFSCMAPITNAEELKELLKE